MVYKRFSSTFHAIKEIWKELRNTTLHPGVRMAAYLEIKGRITAGETPEYAHYIVEEKIKRLPEVKKFGMDKEYAYNILKSTLYGI